MMTGDRAIPGRILVQTRIRPMVKEDLDRVLAIERQSFPYPWNRAFFEEELVENGRTTCLVSVYQGKVVGYYTAWHVAGESSLNKIGVDPDFRGQGIGGRLVEDFLASSFGRGSEDCFLEVAVNNEPALALYEKFGFEKVGIRRNYYAQTGLDAYVMRKKRKEEA